VKGERGEEGESGAIAGCVLSSVGARAMKREKEKRVGCLWPLLLLLFLILSFSLPTPPQHPNERTIATH
jgi:hypothetical protein